ncbi:DNA-binding protein [Serratia sp. Leaf50]|uniref:helix-turn-helix domain-containing protein n=1 Tax=Rouxiella sp. S1S-2 TaxID=2653856 RepID=UPI0006FAEDE6|nr:helix-turn-helix domain-containing protein [Rouxiella sp. S1S-2]KAB7895986.1 helix-turn-helix domain-containing protein [Rouxiella sp. S1S-2]KQN46914.1 DNA-binding protein [Serratia sp. Leaf50]
MNENIPDKLPDNAARLHAIWNKKKVELRLTQEKAADALGFSTQATVSQYLRGKIPLNTDAVLKFAVLLQVKPEEIDPSLTDLMNYIRSSSPSTEQVDSVGWRLLKPQQAELIEIFNRLPESEKEQHLKELKTKTENYDRLFEELLAARKQ